MTDALCHKCNEPLDETAKRVRYSGTNEDVDVHEKCIYVARQEARARDVEKLIKERACAKHEWTGVEHCPKCDAEYEEQKRQHRAQQDLMLRMGRIEGRFGSNARGLPKTGARFGDPNWKPVPKVANGLQQWKPELGSMLVLGPTGCGKTTSIEARVHADFERHKANAIANEPGEPYVSFAYTTGFELSGCRRRSELGDEAPLLRRMKEAGVAFLDELGFEPLATDGEVFALVDFRYCAALPTIVCSGLTLEAFTARYGGAFVRRITERGLIVNAHPRATKGQVRSVG